MAHRRFNDPTAKLKQIRDADEKHAIKGLMTILENNFGFNYIVENGAVVEVQMVSAGLVSIPRGLTRLPVLYNLQLQSNIIRRLRHLANCKNVEIINLSDNQLTDKDLAPLLKLEGLKTLDLSYNKIESLDILDGLKSLESLTITHNQIQKIPPLPNLSKLKFLDLSNNPIKDLANIHKLEHILDLKLDKGSLSPSEANIVQQGIEPIIDFCIKKEEKK